VYDKWLLLRVQTEHGVCERRPSLRLATMHATAWPQWPVVRVSRADNISRLTLLSTVLCDIMKTSAGWRHGSTSIQFTYLLNNA